ncbi:MAG: Ser-Thr-rich GPI-anchored membrane family protein, partial [Candidatus Thorarchaeota archaeon]
VPAFGILDVWVLLDLDVTGGVSYYEKNTGILLYGLVYYYGGLYNYTFELFDTNAFVKTLTVSIPDSSNSWETASSESIYWTSTGFISTVKIELYKDGAFLMEIASSTLNDGAYAWSIPTTLDNSTQYQIKISDTADPLIFDFSDYFEITKPASVPGGIPGYNLLVLIGIIGVISIIIIKNRKKT